MISNTTGSQSRRKPLTAQQKHAVFARDGGHCSFQHLTGNRCRNLSWLHLHHIHPVSLGGGNDSSNLATLCAFHHELVHQLSLPIEGQVSWVRERTAAYR